MGAVPWISVPHRRRARSRFVKEVRHLLSQGTFFTSRFRKEREHNAGAKTASQQERNSDRRRSDVRRNIESSSSGRGAPELVAIILPARWNHPENIEHVERFRQRVEGA